MKIKSGRSMALSGFTLLEMIVVIAIIGILSAIIVPNTVSNIRDSKIESANTYAYELYTATQNYLTDQQIKNIPLRSDEPPDWENPASAFPTDETDKFIFYVKGREAVSSGFSAGYNMGNTDDKKMMDKALSGISNYIGSAADSNTLGVWAAQVDLKTYTVDWVIYSDQEDAEASIKSVANDPQKYTQVFGRPEGGRSRSQEFDTVGHNSDSSKNVRFVGQYPIPYKG